MYPCLKEAELPCFRMPEEDQKLFKILRKTQNIMSEEEYILALLHSPDILMKNNEKQIGITQQEEILLLNQDFKNIFGITVEAELFSVDDTGQIQIGGFITNL